MILAIGPRLEGHSVFFVAIQTHPSCRFLLAVDSLGLRRSGSWSQPVNEARDLGEQRSWDGDLCDPNRRTNVPFSCSRWLPPPASQGANIRQLLQSADGLLLANNGLSGHVAGTSALPPTTDIRAPKSAFAPISSASPPGADLHGGVAEGPFLTRSRHWRGWTLI